MSRGQNPLMLMMALSLPGAANALGLGEIHVDSALNEPLAAEIDIVGATAEELAGLTATVANRETFLKFGADRPAFLNSAVFKVAHDVRGRPVLSIRSTESFSEPLVNLVLDLRWHTGEVIRQYSLLLDPSGFPAATQVATQVAAALPSAAPPIAHAPAAAATVTAAETATAGETATAAVKSTRTMTHVKVGAKATLRGIAWRVGARADIDVKKTMLAIFRANPGAFEGNINRLHLGATLTIPAQDAISAISAQEAAGEIRAQMAAWRAGPKARAAAAPAVAAEPTTTAAPQVPASPVETDAVLNQRIQTLEQGLHDVQGQLLREHDQLVSVQAQVQYAAKTAASVPSAASERPAPRPSRLPSILGGMTLLAGALAAIYLRFRRRPARKAGPNLPIPTESFLERSADAAPASAIVEAPVRHDPPRTPQRPIMTEDGMELSAAWNSVRDKQEAKVRAQLTAALTTAAAAPRQSVITATEEELRAAYEDTLDLSGETAILAAEIAAASGDTANLPAATVNLRAEALRQAAQSAAMDAEIDADATASVATMSIASAFGDTEPTVEQPSAAAALNVDATKLDYNLVDLDLTAQHVQMPSDLHEHVVVKERRTNLVDVLKMAIEREPDRRDLRMKLLETYYAAAATNRQGFLEVVQKLARERDCLGAGEWEKIAFMGKQIASDTGLFAEAEESEDDKLADCA
jgi:pilus assembly protein FimV